MPGSEGHFYLMLFSTGYGKYVDIGFGGFGFINKNMGYQRNGLPYSENEYIQMENLCKSQIQSQKKLVCKDSDWLDLRTLAIEQKEYMESVKNHYSAVRQHKNN
jgi:hypothetical protein